MKDKAVALVVVFDLGGVLIDWNPRYLYRKLFDGDEQAMEAFLRNVCSPEWNVRQDAGRSFAEAIAEKTAEFPEQATLIAAFFERWPEMLGGANEGSVAILSELKQADFPLYALTNWSQETFPVAQARFPFLGLFDGIVVSGEERLIKPELAIYRILLERFAIDPATALFIDDSLANVEASIAAGMKGIHFTDPAKLRIQLRELGLLQTA